MKTGWPSHLLQDDSRKLSDWFASRVDARWTVRQVCAEIKRNRMSEKQPEALRLADALDIAHYEDGDIELDAAALLRTQHAALERKDALLRQALAHVASNICMTDGESKAEDLYDAIRKELQ